MKKPFRFLKWSGKKAVTLFVVTLLLVFTVVDVTFAILVTKTDALKNIFFPPDMRISMEGADDINNVGDVPVYVRAFAVANWISETDEHTILPETPQFGVDFTADFVMENWFLASDGFYYYRHVLEAGEAVEFLRSATQIKQKEGFELQLRIVSEAIQVTPVDAIHEAWPAVRVARVDDRDVLVKVEEGGVS